MMIRSRHRLSASLALAFGVVATVGLSTARAAEPASPTPAGVTAGAGGAYDREIVPLLKTYCYQCHGDGKKKGGLALDAFTDLPSVHAGKNAWEAILDNVRARDMPTEDADAQPTDAEREKLIGWIERELFRVDAANPDPGRVLLRRLNRAEYKATIRDLVGVDFDSAADFPPDDSGYGFDNIGDVLSMPPVLLEKYLAAAEKILDQAIVTDPLKSEVRRIPASLAQVGFNAIGDRGDGWVHLISLEEDDVSVDLNVPAGDYHVRVLAFARRVGGALKGQGSETPLVFATDPGPTKLAVMINDTFVRDFELTNDEAKPQVYEARVGVTSGRQRFRAVVKRERGGEHELAMLNGRLGKQQPGIVFVKWLEIEGPLSAATRRTAAAQLEAPADVKLTGAGERLLARDGEVAAVVDLPRETEVILRAHAYAQQAGAEPARMEFRVDGKPLRTFDVLAPARMQPLPGQRVFSPALLIPVPQVYEARAKLPAGRHRFSAAFVNDFADPENKNPNLRDRNLIVQSLEVSDLSAPVMKPPLPGPLAELFARAGATAAANSGERAEDGAKAARDVLARFARRAWRRQVAPAEVDRLMKLYAIARADGDGFEAGVKLAMKAVLVSPHFLFLGETQPASVRSAGPRPLGESALASRLSYFLWSSSPDDELLDLAERGELRAQLPAQVRRMLASPKATALVDNFAGQWLQIRSLDTFQPDKQLFPAYDAALRAAMQRETELFFEHVLREDRSVLDFLTGDYTFVNARLAKFYGFANAPGGEEFQKVSLAGTPRRGVLTHGSILTLTSNPTRTSPVKRGKWVLENLLGTPPPPAPPDVPELDDKERKLTGTLRQQMEQHRENPSCASCHARMDPIGFGLENFDAIGAWRDKDGGAPIDPSGKLAGGDVFAGATDLVAVLANQRRKEFLHCLAEKMLTYALGRGAEYYDRPALDGILKRVDADDGRFSSLILAVAESFPFQMRRGDEPLPAPAVAALSAHGPVVEKAGR